MFISSLQDPKLIMNHSSRLHEARDTASLLTITLDLLTRTYPIISHTQSLPHGAQTLTPCPSTLGGVLITTPNAVLHVDQSGGVVGRAGDAWFPRVSGLTSVAPPDVGVMGTGPEGVDLDGAFVAWVALDETEATMFLPNGAVRSVRIEREGRAVHALGIGPELGTRLVRSERSAVCVLGERYGYGFMGSLDGEGVLVRVMRAAGAVAGTGVTAEEHLEESDEEMEDEDGEFTENVCRKELVELMIPW